MKRGSGPRRRSWLPSRSAPMARSRIARHSRPAAETERAHGPAEKRAWMKAQPCLVCGRTPCDAAHVASGGTGRKDDTERTVPLCADDPRTGYVGHHSEYDGRARAGGKRTFLAKYELTRDDLLDRAAACHAAFLREAA